MSIYEANPQRPIKIVSIEELNECYNNFEDITAKTNDEIKQIQESNANEENIPRFLKQNFAISIRNFTQFFKPRLSPFGKVEMNVSISEENAKHFLEFGENFRNYIFNNNHALTGKMPECIEMGIEEKDMKYKLQFRESMPCYEKSEPVEKYNNYFNTIVMKNDEQYGISSFIPVSIQLMHMFIDIFNRDIPDYFENDSKILRIINDTKYLITDIERITKTEQIKIHYDYNLFLDIKKLRKDIQQGISSEEKESKISELKSKLIKFDENHWTFEKLNSYMLKNKKTQILAAEISPNMLQFSNYRFDEMYEQNPNMKNEDYLDNGIFYFRIQEYIKGKKEMRNDTPTISKATKSRYVFSFKLLIFDERKMQKKVITTRPSYFKSEPEPEPEVDEESIEVDEQSIEVDEVPDSDDEQ